MIVSGIGIAKAYLAKNKPGWVNLDLAGLVVSKDELIKLIKLYSAENYNVLIPHDSELRKELLAMGIDYTYVYNSDITPPFEGEKCIRLGEKEPLIKHLDELQ